MSLLLLFPDLGIAATAGEITTGNTYMLVSSTIGSVDVLDTYVDGFLTIRTKQKQMEIDGRDVIRYSNLWCN